MTKRELLKIIEEETAFVLEAKKGRKKSKPKRKTNFSLEKKRGLAGWFDRGSGGWVDCNTCRKDKKSGRKKCKPCGRKKGEKRKYPACRPTPSDCGTGGNWGKKSKRKRKKK